MTLTNDDVEAVAIKSKIVSSEACNGQIEEEPSSVATIEALVINEVPEPYGDEIAQRKITLRQLQAKMRSKGEMVETLRQEVRNRELVYGMVAEALKKYNIPVMEELNLYQKPYPAYVDKTPFPPGYQRLNFPKYDGTGSSQQHIAHFIAACGNTTNIYQLLLRQFVGILTGPAFKCYSRLPPGSISSWVQMEEEFLKLFCDIEKKVQLFELLEVRQKPHEPMIEYIERWRTLAINFTTPIGELQEMEYYIDRMHQELTCYVTSTWPPMFTKMVNKAVQIKSLLKHHGNVSEPFTLVNDDDQLADAMTNTMHSSSQSWNKSYSFDKLMVPKLLDILLSEGMIELPMPKRPGEVRGNNKPNYCQYHRRLGHKTEECHAAKDIIQNFMDKGKLNLGPDSTRDPVPHMV
ncbi:uncharacterized protein LOC105421100 [Amborella trichopoda]|uniref:uncharacterized protein LOC105421100 n=1 Tax=Amborella trichopoda TaxID=13333 RepID=UPI0005D4002B|nr:uncharacterized protein LOC105421100 [Amborella trichopoda]|eukprot:XP_011625572.1 uncharacterized protein LOC105421100 [Amborella trichopoda]